MNFSDTLESPAVRRAAPLSTQSGTHRWQAPGTCGELIQGYIDGVDFMINCPINLYAQAQAVALAAPEIRIAEGHRYEKVFQTLRLLQARFATRLNVAIRIDSPIPRSKGMASSTADVCAAVAASAACAGIELSEVELARILTAVEPSDCTHFHGISHINFMIGDLLDRLPVPHGLRVLALDCGGTLDTLTFDRRKARAVYVQHRYRLVAALTRAKEGLRKRCNATIASAATESTELSQLILPRAQYSELRRLCGAWQVLGINCAHSGTVLGLLYDERQTSGEILRAKVDSHFGKSITILGDYRIIGGGNRAI